MPAGLAVSSDASLLASISRDRSAKVFDIRTLDMMAMLRLPFTPSCAEWIFKVWHQNALAAERCLSCTHLMHTSSSTEFCEACRGWPESLVLAASLPILASPHLIFSSFQAGDSKTKLAIADSDSPDIHIYDVRSGTNEPLRTVRVGHAAPVAAMRFAPPKNLVVSLDKKGLLTPLPLQINFVSLLQF